MSFVRQASLQSRTSSAIFKIPFSIKRKIQLWFFVVWACVANLLKQATDYAQRQRELFVTKNMPCYGSYAQTFEIKSTFSGKLRHGLKG